MSTVRRYWRISSPNGKVYHHITGSLGEGSPTVCGIPVQKGWLYWMPGKWTRARACKRCRR